MDNYNSQHDTKATLDIDALEMLRELMEERFSAVLSIHLETSKKYLKSIHDSLEEGNLQNTAKAAHPFKSSSEQIGATKVADLAREIERRATNGSSVDIERLKMLAAQLEQAQTETAEALTPYLKK